MMNEEMEQFEQRLRRQPMKPVPGEWRGQILAAVAAETQPQTRTIAARRSWLSIVNHRLSTFFWPHPKAWAGLAAAWILILGLNLSNRQSPATLAKRVPSARPSPQFMAELKQQHKLYAEMLGVQPPREEADRRSFLFPKPRSERMTISAA